MADAAVEQLRARTEVEVVAPSGDPDDTVSRYGWEAVPRFGFAGLVTDLERDARLDAILAAAGGDVDALAWDDPAWTAVHAVAAADGVLVSGGGNLNSTWPEHVYERACVAQLAARLGTPLVVTGQTLGPHLTERHGRLVSSIVTSAQLVGVREQASWQVARDLGVPEERLVLTVDDAAELSGEYAGRPTTPYVAATFSPHAGLVDVEEYVSALARTLDHVVETYDVDVLLVPHHTSGDAGDGDVAMHRAVAERTTCGRVRELGQLTARETAAVAHGAALVLSTRYHPLVFAVAGGVPAIGVGVDRYTTVKIVGALENYGVGAYALPVASLLDGTVVEAVDEVWSRREELAETLRAASGRRRDRSAEFWDAVARALTGEPGVGGLSSIEPLDQVEAGTWWPRAQALLRFSDAISGRLTADVLAADRVRAELVGAQQEIGTLELRLVELEEEIDELRAENALLRESGQASQRLLSTHLAQVQARLDTVPRVHELQRELEALHATRTLRLLRVPRQVYAQVRRVRTDRTS